MLTANTEELRCPKCLAELAAAEHGLVCRAGCAEFPMRDGILDFRSGRHDYYFNPVPVEQMTRLTDAMTEETWPESIREFIRGTRMNVGWLDNLIVDGRYAWKLFLALNKSSTLLDLGCGLGNLTHNLAPLVGRTYALDLTYARLQFSRKRFSIFNAQDDIVTLAGGDGVHLPFRDGTFDCVVLSGVLEWVGEGDSSPFHEGSKLTRVLRMLAYHFGERNPRRIQIRFLREIRRILKPTGQLFVAIENRLNHEYFAGRPDHHSMLKYGSLLPRFLANLYSIAVNRAPYRTYTFSMRGYRKLMRAAGFPNTEFLGLTRGYSVLEEILPADVSSQRWRPDPPANLRERIRRSGHFVPAYGIIASRAPKPWPQAQDELLRQVERAVRKNGSERLVTHSYKISGKQKLIIRASVGERTIAIRIPFNSAAREAEANSARMQTEMKMRPELAPLIPQTLCEGEAGGLSYWAEAYLPGTALCDSFATRPREQWIPQIEALLESANFRGGELRLQRLQDELYGKLVSRPLGRVLAVVADAELRNAAGDFFRRELEGVQASIGIFHGDFGARNVLVEADRISGLIDWESGSLEGMPLLDALNYLLSVQLQSDASRTLPQVVPRLAHGPWPSEPEWEFVQRRYAALGMDMSRHAGWAYLAWVHHIGQRITNLLRYDPVGIEQQVVGVLRGMTEGAR